MSFLISFNFCELRTNRNNRVRSPDILAPELNIPEKIEDFCDLIDSSEARLIDLGRCDGKYFVCMAGIGFDAHIVAKADKRLKKYFGAAAYFFEALKEYFFYNCIK